MSNAVERPVMPWPRRQESARSCAGRCHSRRGHRHPDVRAATCRRGARGDTGTLSWRRHALGEVWEGRLRCRGASPIPERVSGVRERRLPWSRASWAPRARPVAFTFDSARVSAMSRHPFDHVAGRAAGRDTPARTWSVAASIHDSAPGGPPRSPEVPPARPGGSVPGARPVSPFRLLGALGQARCSLDRAHASMPFFLGRDGAHDGRHEPALRPERERRAKGGSIASAPAWSALFRTSTSAISMRPAFRVWIASPDSGVSTTIVVSAVSATSSSDCPTPTVSMSVVSLPQASSSSASSLRAGREAAQAAPRRHAPDEDLAVRGVLAHADPVAQDRPARERTRGVHHDDAHLPALRAEEPRHGDQRALPRPRRGPVEADARGRGLPAVEGIEERPPPARRFRRATSRGPEPGDRRSGCRSPARQAMLPW